MSAKRTNPKRFNLFVYGTLMNPAVFRGVLGKRLVLTPEDARNEDAVYACDAVLDRYKKASPDNTYLYAIPEPQGRIRGYLIGPLDADRMAALRKYEGRNYSRRTFRIRDAAGLASAGRRPKQPAIYISNRPEWERVVADNLTAAGNSNLDDVADVAGKAMVFIGNIEQLEHHFGYAFHDAFKQEILLREKIERALLEAESQRPEAQSENESEKFVARRALGELHGPTIRDLTRRHFEAGGVSDYAIRHSIKDSPLPDFDVLRNDPEARALAPNYLRLVVRQVLFNQIEDKVRQEYRYQLDHMGLGERYYDRTVSSLVTLRLLNAQTELMDMLAADAMNELDFQQDHLVDFVRWAIVAADSIYDSRTVRTEMNYIQNHLGHGYVSLGAELEFSNIGHGVIRDPKGQSLRDSLYDGFLYFAGFGLDTLTWKLGGHVDDHHEKASRRPRRGFFEVALGNLSIQANLSKPITDDPWLLNQIIHETRRFYPINPHSVHLSLQLRTQHRPSRDRLPPIYALKCLFALAGDPAPRYDGRGGIQINRLVSDEIMTVGETPQMQFSDISRRRSQDADEFNVTNTPGSAGRYVQQFKFLRLASEINYEPIAMALKGVQISLAPGSFLLPSQSKKSERHRELFEDVLAWGANPTPIPQQELEAFLGHVYDGLMTERRGRPAHTEAYIAWSLGQLREGLHYFNDLAAGKIILGRRNM